MSKRVHCLMLVTRAAMLPEALALSRELLGRGGCRITQIKAAAIDHGVSNHVEDERFAIEPEACGQDVRPTGVWRVGPLRTLALTIAIGRKRRAVAARLRELKPDVVIVFEDRFIDPEAIWLAEAYARKVPAILVRYASSSIESDVWSRRGRRGYSLSSGAFAWLRRIFAHRHPDHVLDHRDSRLLFYPTWDSWALALCGLADGNPRVVGGGHVARVAVQGMADLEAAESVSGLTGRFVVTGQPSLDAMPLERPAPGAALRLICALPQWAEHEQLTWERHMALLERLGAILGTSGTEVLLSLHPKADRGRYQSLADRYALAISDCPLMEILSSADIFLASWSSTLRWSAMMGVASINLDWAGQAYGGVSDPETSVLSKGPDDLEELLNRMIVDNGFRLSVGEQLRRDSAPLGLIDGQACARVVKLIDEVVGIDGGIGEAR